MHLESAIEVVIVEGEASYEQHEGALERFCGVYNPKYGWDFTPTTTGWILAVAPTRILAWRTVPVAQSKGTPFPLAGAKFVPS